MPIHHQAITHKQTHTNDHDSFFVESFDPPSLEESKKTLPLD